MEKLLSVFASADHAGMARRLFAAFLSKKPIVDFSDDTDLNVAASRHANIRFFCDAALSAPNGAHRTTGKTRIHQALKSAGWDISKLLAPTDLGVPAFNIGNVNLSTGDFDNGLGVMVNGIQYAYVMAQGYHYDAKAGVLHQLEVLVLRCVRIGRRRSQGVRRRVGLYIFIGGRGRYHRLVAASTPARLPAAGDAHQRRQDV
jgi:hypothetical protein